MQKLPEVNHPAASETREDRSASQDEFRQLPSGKSFTIAEARAPPREGALSAKNKSAPPEFSSGAL
jgi:hypothetical protein